ncbi:mitochondrial carrier [Suillus lakei]|nr:mitochondrial carrier [Suillus lakei]
MSKAMKAHQATAAIPQFTSKDYSYFFLAGALCCTITHGAMTPVDVVKTRIQIDPAYKKLNMLTGTRYVIATEGPKALLTGFGPTAVGYFIQGGAKFAGYEYWKKTAVESVGGTEAAVKYRTAIYLGSASIAEFFADILLTPLEATRIRLVSDRTYATGLVTGFTRLAREGGMRELYAGFIPYAIGQFTVNEFCHEIAFRSMSEETRRTLSSTSKFTIQLGSGVIAGFAAAILSHPADTLLSQINKGHGPRGSMPHRLTVLAREAGFRGLFAGLGPRMDHDCGSRIRAVLTVWCDKRRFGRTAWYGDTQRD